MREQDVEELANVFAGTQKAVDLSAGAGDGDAGARPFWGGFRGGAGGWIAFDLVEPIGGLRGDYQAAVVAATVTNSLRGGKGKRLGLDDFLPFGDASTGGAGKRLLLGRRSRMRSRRLWSNRPSHR